MKYELKKAKAIEFMKQLDFYKPYVKGFEEENLVCFFENYGGFWAYQEPQLYDKMKELELKNKCTVYAITHEFTEFGECYSFLIVTDYKSEWKTLLQSNGNTHYAFAYVWNKDDDWCSEFGTIVVKSLAGGIKRIG